MMQKQHQESPGIVPAEGGDRFRNRIERLFLLNILLALVRMVGRKKAVI